MNSTTLNRRKKTIAAVRIGVVAAALAVSGVAVSQASYSAFSATTSNTSNSIKSGALSLNTNKTAALFAIKNMVPGDTANQLITVSSKGSSAGDVRLYSANGTAPVADGGLGSYISLKVEEGTVVNNLFTPDKTGSAKDGVIVNTTLANFIANNTDYSSGAGNWSVGGGTDAETKTYRITASLSKTAPNSVQGKTSQTDFVWEVQSGQS